jgi:hypothetical protein
MTTSLLLEWLPITSVAATTDLATSIGNLSVALVCAAVIMLIILVAAAAITHERRPQFKAPLFTLIVLVTVVTTLVISGVTVALNLSSSTGGPVRWGSDYQIWACGNQLDLRDPQGMMGSRIGTSTLYEQNDGRIHYNGTPTTLPNDASLGKFMQVVGGEISDSSLVVPLNDQTGFTGQPTSPEQVAPYISTDRNGASARFVNDQSCGTEEAQIQVFAYHYSPVTKTYYQTKLDHPANYELSRTDASPPGDCVIVEFAPLKDQTDHLCYGYGVRDYDRCTEFGVAADKVASCDIRELR